MATLYVRNVPQALHDELKRWADESGRSVNAEVLVLLEREAEERRRRESWLEELVAASCGLGLTREDGDLAIQAIREHRDAGP